MNVAILRKKSASKVRSAEICRTQFSFAPETETNEKTLYLTYGARPASVGLVDFSAEL